MPAGARCRLTVVYAGGSRQRLETKAAQGGRVAWEWSVSRSAEAGPARLIAACGRAGRATGTVIVVGQLIPPRIKLLKSGFSARPKAFGGTDVSYGIVLKNTSPNADAVNVNVLVNFVLANNRLLGSKSTNVSVRAGSSYALGDMLNFPGAAPIVRLEVVIQVGERQPRSAKPPAVDGVGIEPSQWEPAWVGAVAGELINDNGKRTLSNASLSAVILDAQGNVIGGANGSVFQSLPPGTRHVFKLTSAAGAVPTAQAKSVLVTVVPTWRS